LTILPPSFSRGNAHWVIQNGPLKFVARISSMSTAVEEPRGVLFHIPALLIRKSSLRWPNWRNIVSISSTKRRSARTRVTSRPIDATTSGAASRLRLKCRTMSAPSFASRRQIARPIPREPPVISAVFPLSVSICPKLQVPWHVLEIGESVQRRIDRIITECHNIPLGRVS